MIRVEPSCPKCGTPVSADALQGLCPKCLGTLAFGTPSEQPRSSRASAPPPTSRRFGDYELLEEIARGGMGVVYKARQLSLNRIVAVKMVLHGPFSSPEFVDRFRTETAAIAGLRHPNIVTIYNVGEQDGFHFFSMEYIDGQNLADLVRDKPLPAELAAETVRTMALAIHYAHQHGIIHRDLKPSNVLLDPFGQVRITDFGLAKLLNSDLNLTTTGQVLGSPNHMPPEQATGKFSNPQPEGDVYSLGAILYHLLTGRPPFQGQTLQEILIQVQNDPPIPPRRLNPGVPEGLETICLKCLRKEPAKRYPSAQALAEDISRFLAHKPILARPASLAEKISLWCRRRPVLAALSFALALTMVLGVCGILWQWRRAERHAQGESTERLRALESADKVRLNLYAADISLAAQAIHHDDYGLARQTLAGLRPKTGEPDLRGFEWRYLWNLCRGDQAATMTGHQWIVTCTAFSPDGKSIATGSQDGTARIWNAATHHPITVLALTGAVWSVQFSPDGSLLMTAGTDGEVRFWNTTTWKTAGSFPGQIAALSTSGSLVAIADSNPLYWEPAGVVSLWDYRLGVKLREFHRKGRSLALSPDGSKLAAAADPRGIDVWDLQSGRLLRTLPTDRPVWSLHFSPDSAHLVAAGWSNEILVWSLAENQPPKKISGHQLTVWSTAYSPDGTELATTASDQTIRLWNTTSLTLKTVLHGHDNEVWSVDYSPDGKWLVSGGKDCNVLLWSLAHHSEPGAVPNLNDTRPLFSPDGKYLATTIVAGHESRTSLWDPSRRTLLFDLPENPILGFSPDGTQIVTWDQAAGQLTLSTPGDGRFTRLALDGLRPNAGPFSCAGFSPKQDVFFGIDDTGLVRFWETGRGKLLGTVHGPQPPIRTAVLGPDGIHLALAIERENLVRLYDRSKHRETLLSRHHDFVSGLAFSPDGTLLASGSVDGTIILWETASGRALGSLPGHMEEASDVAFSPDGRTLASVSHRESIKLWHLPTRRELMSIDFPQAGRFLQFSPDGRQLVVATDDNSLRVLDAPLLVDSTRPGP